MMTPLTVGAEIRSEFDKLGGLWVFKSWNVFATRYFYFATPGRNPRDDTWDFRLTLECPWRIERAGRILVGSGDYGLAATDNTDPAWNPAEAQWGHLQDERLEEIFGESRNGELFNSKGDLLIEAIDVDPVGGVRIHLSGDYLLTIFPAASADLQWMISAPCGVVLSLRNCELTVGNE